MITADFHILWNHMIIWLSIFFIINQSPVILSWGHQGFLSLRFVMCIGCLVEYKVTLFQESKKYWRGYVPTVLCAYCAATMKLLWTLASKQPTLQLRFECCDHGLYIACSVAGIIFASPLKAVLGDLDVSTDAAWSTGHSAIHSLVTWSEESFSSMIDSVDGQASSVNPCVWTHWVLFSESSTVVHAKGGQVHFPWLVVVFGVRGNEWFGCMSIPRLLLLLRKWMGRRDGCNTLPLFPRPWVMTSFLWLCPG